MFIVVQLDRGQPEFRMIMQGTFIGYQVLGVQIAEDTEKLFKLNVGWRDVPMQRRIVSPGVYLLNQEAVTESFHSFEYYPADSVVALSVESPNESFRELYINSNNEKLLENEGISLLLDINTD